MMLRVYFVQQWFNLSDPGGEEAFYESPALCRFRHFIEKYELGGAKLDRINRRAAAHRMCIAAGTTVGATIIAAPGPTQNAKGERDPESPASGLCSLWCEPEMHQPRKGNQRHFGFNSHIVLDSRKSIVHSACITAAR